MKRSITEILNEMESAKRPADTNSPGEPIVPAMADPATSAGGGDAHANRPADQLGGGDVVPPMQGSSVVPPGEKTPIDPAAIPAPLAPTDPNQKWDELMSMLMKFKPINESSYLVKMNTADFGNIFESEGISEEFAKKAVTIFESAVNERIKSEVVRLNTVANEYFTEQSIEIQKSFVAEAEKKVDAYLNYVVEQWVHENKIAIESGMKVAIAENFLTGMKNLFVENYVEVPEAKSDLVEELVEKINVYESRLAESVKSINDMRKSMNESAKSQIVAEATRGLTQVTADKIKSLAETVEFNDSRSFKDKVTSIVESFSKVKATPSANSVIVEDNGKTINEDVKKVVSEIPEMDMFVNAARMFSAKK